MLGLRNSSSCRLHRRGCWVRVKLDPVSIEAIVMLLARQRHAFFRPLSPKAVARYPCSRSSLPLQRCAAVD